MEELSLGKQKNYLLRERFISEFHVLLQKIMFYQSCICDLNAACNMFVVDK